MKYNWSIIGHERELARLERDIESGNLAHAYLLVGPNSIGKSTVARKLAGILQCENNFCHECNTCLQVEKGCHRDTIELRDEGESIKIEEIRKLVERLNMSAQSPYKVAMLQGVERMTLEAANSFLKILEEPPQNTIFIMTANSLQLLLPTVVSRVRVIKFRSSSVPFLKERLTELYPDRDEEEIARASVFSLGRTGKAVHLMENRDELVNYVRIYNDVQIFLEHRNLVERFGYAEALLETDRQVDVFLDILTHVLRSKVLEGTPEKNRYINTLSKIDETAILLKKNVNARLVLENLMLTI